MRDGVTYTIELKFRKRMDAVLFYDKITDGRFRTKVPLQRIQVMAIYEKIPRPNAKKLYTFITIKCYHIHILTKIDELNWQTK